MMEEVQKRQIAYKTNITNIVSGRFVRQEGWLPNYIIDNDNNMLSRVNVLGVIVSKDNMPEDNFSAVTIDDGSAKIQVRDFDKEKMNDFEVGNVVNIIGKIREYAGNVYIFPEIMKKLDDNRWILVRKKEIEKLKKLGVYEKYQEQETKVMKEETFIQAKEEENIEESVDSGESRKIYELIKTLDNGDGVDIDVVIKESGMNNSESIILELLKNGEVFELKPGRIKALE